MQVPEIETYAAEETPQVITAVAVQNKAVTPVQQLRLDSMSRFENTGEMLSFAALLISSNLLPKTIDTPEKAVVIAQKGQSLGISFDMAVDNIWVLDNKPVLSSGLVSALANRADIRFRWLQDKADVLGPVDPVTGVAPVIDWIWEIEMMQFWHGEVLKDRMTLKWTECQTAGWTKNPTWTKHPRAMARARLIVQIIRALRPDVLMGCYEVSEIADSSNGHHQYAYDADSNTTKPL